MRWIKLKNANKKKQTTKETEAGNDDVIKWMGFSNYSNLEVIGKFNLWNDIGEEKNAINNF